MTLVVACGLRREARIIKRVGMIPVAGGGRAEALDGRLEDTIAEYAGEGWTFDAVLSCGLAGALEPELRPGDRVLGTISPIFDTASERNTKPLRDDERSHRLVAILAKSLPGARLGMVAGQDGIAATAAAKAALRARTGAIAVDMESHVAARVAARHSLPFAAVRIISDRADDDLPAAALVGMKPDGRMALGAVLLSLARDPRQLPALIRTGSQAERAFHSLGRALDALEAFRINSLNAGELALDVRRVDVGRASRS